MTGKFDKIFSKKKSVPEKGGFFKPIRLNCSAELEHTFISTYKLTNHMHSFLSENTCDSYCYYTYLGYLEQNTTN
jgi:hypothetical protein